MKSLHQEYETHPCFQDLVAHGAEPWQARYLTARLNGFFGEDLPRVLSLFWERGWTGEEIWNLDRASKTWRKNPATFFDMENALVTAGCSVALARRVLASPVLLEANDPTRICLAIAAFRKCGLDDNAIMYAMINHVRSMLQSPQRIAAWHVYVTEKGLHPLTNMRILISTKSFDEAKARIERPFTLDLSRFLQEHIPLMPAELESPPAHDVQTDELPSPVSNAEATAVVENPPPAVDEKKISLVPPVEPSCEPDDAAPVASDAPVEERPSDAVPRDEMENFPEDAAPDSGTRVQDQPSIPQSTPPVPSTHVGVSPQAVSIPGPPALPGDSLVPLLPTPLPPCMFSPVVKQERPKPHVVAPYVPDTVTRDWHALAEYILKMVVPNWTPGKWRAWVKKNPWIESIECTEITNLEQILGWVPYGGTKPPNDSRAQLLASVLLNRDLIAVYRKSKRARGNGRYTTQASAQVKRRRILVGLLQLPEEVIYFRFYVLRSIVVREPRKHPDALDYPFERVEKFTEPLPRNFSIPPPPMTDERMWQAKAAELRWRVDELERRHYIPGRKPFVLMLTETTRVKFLKRLDRYEAEHGHDEIVVTRRNKGIVTPFSPLA